MKGQPYIFEWDGRYLVPASPHDVERLQKYKPGQQLKADKLVKPRSLPMQGKYWACLAEVVAATEIVPTSEHLHDLIKMKTGYVTPAVLKNGEVCWIADSTAFDKMDDGQFLEFIKNADRWCLETLGVPLMRESEAA